MQQNSQVMVPRLNFIYFSANEILVNLSKSPLDIEVVLILA
jgi:hypothetical protein